jgi:phosphatidate cytidylyltransferase
MNKINFLKTVGVVYLFFAFFLAYLLREKFSLGLFILILIICVFTDLGGYIFGKILKGPKLTKISPKKTYAGAFGGFILSLVAALVYSKYTTYGSSAYLNLSIWTGLVLNKIYFLFILIMSLISQVGDLIISYFKRLARVKDTGNLLPGHGGLLDRIDGIVFVMPISYLLLSYLVK